MDRLKHFRFWCQKVIPLVYDDSLSYYEVLCKVKDKLNEIITQQNTTGEAVESLQLAVDELNACCDEVKKTLDGDLTDLMKDIIEKTVKMVFFGLTDAGYFVAFIPDSWDEITFETTGYDYMTSDYDFGHLVLSY